MEASVINQAKFIFKNHKYQLIQLDIDFYPTEDKKQMGMRKTSFKLFLDDKFIGYVPLDMLALIPEKIKEPDSKFHVLLKIAKPGNFNYKNIPFSKDMKTAKFLGKIFKQDHMTQVIKDRDHISLVRDRYSIKRERRKNKK